LAYRQQHIFQPVYRSASGGENEEEMVMALYTLMA